MDAEDRANLFATMEGVIKSTIADKKQDPNWASKIAKANVRVNIGLQMSKTEYYFMHMILSPGKDVVVAEGQLPDYDLELQAAPGDLIFFCNRTFGTVHMVTKKNEFGDTKLRVKKGIQNVGKLLFVQALLQV
jgi:hypothetical protein